MSRFSTSMTLQPDSEAPAIRRPRQSALIPSLNRTIQNLTRTQPVLATQPPPQHASSWTCPKTQIVIPKTLKGNLEWRRRILEETKFNEDLQAQLRAACARSPWLWINLFVWTFRQKKVVNGEEVPCTGHEAHHPFVTWLVQDEFIGELCDAIDGGHDVLINKSRDMGASWLCLTVLHWYWQFRPSCTFLELSRKEEYVDKRGSMDSLFEKHRYILKWQPTWIRPRRIDDKYMHLGNLDNGSAIEGESTNGDAGRGGRKTGILLDEFAAVQNGEEVDRATADTTASRIYNSTPGGPGTQFSKIFFEKRARILILPWWRHPEKSVGAHQVLDEQGRPKWTSPWYESESLRRSKKAMAQEVDMDHGQAGDVFFDANEIERHRAAHQKEPILLADLKPADDYGEERKAGIIRKADHHSVVLLRDGQRPAWRFWIPLIDNRPPQSLSYVFGIDISNGSGGSNSVITVAADEINQIVAKFWSPFVSPEELAEIACFAGIWFGGNHGPAFMCWENNGPGGIFGRKVIKLGYSHIYFQRVDQTKAQEKTSRYGWHSNQKRKEVLLGMYREALARDRIINPCKESLDEALDYVYDESGLLIPGKLKEESGGGRALHGDHVIADALVELARAELPKTKSLKARPPTGSFADRRRIARKQLEAANEWSG